ncbi:MAG: hypothetical protein ACR2OX_09580 [Methyloligellaceae bacterium]
MRTFWIVIGMMIVGFMAGLFYAYLPGSSEPSTIVVTVAEKPKKPDTKRAAASILRAQELRARRLSMRNSAEEFFANLEDDECDLDPANLELYADDARYSMRYRLPDGEEKSLELRGKEFKSFGIGTAKELSVSGLQCTTRGRFFQVEDDRVRVHEQRTLEAIYQGDSVEIHQKRTLVVGPNENGDWVIHEITGAGVIR